MKNAEGRYAMKNKVLLWAFTIILSLPVPISLITILGSIISLANIGMLSENSFLLALVAAVSMLLAGTYSITYTISTISTFRNKKISIASFAPVFHMLITAVFFVAWIILEKIYL